MLSSEQLDDLIATLHQRGFATSVEQRAELVRLLAHHVEDISLRRTSAHRWLLRAERLIGPLVCNTAEEQRRFGQAFADWATRWRAAPRPDPAPVASTVVSTSPADAPLPSKWASVMGCLALLVTLFVFAFNVDDMKVTRPYTDSQWMVPDRLAAPTSAPPPRSSASANNDGTGVLRLVGLIAPMLIFAFWLHWRLWSRRTVLGRFPNQDDSGVTRRLAKGVAPSTLFPNAELALLVDFRRWRHEGQRGVDVERTIDATAREGGRVVIVPRAVAEEQTYVAFIELRSYEDHAARHARLLVELLKERELSVDVFLFQGLPVTVVAEDGRGDSVEIEVVRKRYPRACFLLFLDPSTCANPFDGSPLPWLGDLADEHPCALLTNEPINERLATLAGCVVVPRTLAGLSTIPARIEQHRSFPVPSGRDESHDALFVGPAWDGDRSALRDGLRSRFEPAVLHWLAALAVYPRISFDLTLFLGAHLFDERGERLLNESRLALLARAGWLRDARIPARVRECLIEQLSRSERSQVRNLLYAVVGGMLLDRPLDNAGTLSPDKQTRDLVRTYVRTRDAGDPIVDRVFSRFLLHPIFPKHRFVWPERLARVLGFRVDAVPLVFVLLTFASVGLIGGLIDYIELHAPGFNDWVASHRMWVGLSLYLLSIGVWSGFWTSVMLNPRFEKFTAELWRRRVRLDNVHPPA